MKKKKVRMHAINFETHTFDNMGRELDAYFLHKSLRSKKHPKKVDPCQWADGRLGRAVQQTVNLEAA